MAYLSDYLGHLLSEITNARVQSDLEAVRIAEYYASHPLLKHLPIPHFRLPTVTLDVPVAVRSLEDSAPDARPDGDAIDVATVKSATTWLHPEVLSKQEITLAPKESALLDKKMTEVLNTYKAEKLQPDEIGKIADELGGSLEETLRVVSRERRGDKIDLEKAKHAAENLKVALRAEFIRPWRHFSRLQVLVTAKELREAGPPNVLATLRLSVTEDAYEATFIDRDGKSELRLIPE